MDYIYSVNGTLFKEISAYPQYTSFAQLIQTQFGGILEHVSSFPITVLVPTNRFLKILFPSLHFKTFFWNDSNAMTLWRALMKRFSNPNTYFRTKLNIR